MADLFTVTQRKAKKTHTCSICGLAILPSSEYIDYKTIRGNRYSYNKTHIHCDAIMDEYTKQTGSIPEWDCMDKVAGWVHSNVCLQQERCKTDDCLSLSCERALKHILPETILNAALHSVKANNWEERRD